MITEDRLDNERAVEEIVGHLRGRRLTKEQVALIQAVLSACYTAAEENHAPVYYPGT